MSSSSSSQQFRNISRVHSRSNLALSAASPLRYALSPRRRLTMGETNKDEDEPGEAWTRAVEGRLAALEASLLASETEVTQSREGLARALEKQKELEASRDEATAAASSLATELDALRRELGVLKDMVADRDRHIADLEKLLIDTKLDKANALAMLDVRASTHKRVFGTPVKKDRSRSLSVRATTWLKGSPGGDDNDDDDPPLAPSSP